MLVLGPAHKLDLAKPTQIVLEQAWLRQRLVAQPEGDIDIRAAVAAATPERTRKEHPEHVRVGQDALLKGREWEVRPQTRHALAEILRSIGHGSPPSRDVVTHSCGRSRRACSSRRARWPSMR